jgi:phage FluMu gp28-like protein
VWSRQSGKSFAAALRAVLKCLERRTQYVVLSKGERQSRVFMEKVHDFCAALKELKALPEFEEIPEPETKALEVVFPHNRSRILGLPANPDTARGYSANVILDEFAFHGDAQKIYAAIYPSITRGFSIEVISTPNGQQGKFFDLAKQAGLVTGFNREPANRWSPHRVDLYQAVKEGLPADLDLLRAGCDDEETWQQEYECAFLSDAQNYVSMELILSCVSEQASDATPFEELRGKELYLGGDIGRRRDLTIFWLFEKLGDVLWSRVLRVLAKQTFEAQEKALDDLMALGVRRACLDASGLGMMLAERAVKKHGARVEGVTFTQQVKEDMAPRVKHRFEERLVRIPDNRDVRSDLNAVKRFVTPAGNIRFDADRTDKGHADRFWALALADMAASGPALTSEPRVRRENCAFAQMGAF